MVSYVFKKFDELTNIELYEIVKLRLIVFIFGRNIKEVDLDDKDYDKGTYHLMGYLDGELISYLRILPAGCNYKNISIGRVAVIKEYRRKGLRKEIMQEAIKRIKALCPNDIIEISAQSYVKNLYLDLGFIQTSDEYIEVDIPHIHMIYNK
ncbi:MAG: GNAT family N-acetyltransferase [Psittacicella sp.]